MHGIILWLSINSTTYAVHDIVVKFPVTCRISIHAGFGVLGNLKCTPQQPYVCVGDEIICNCTAFCNETIIWLDNNTLPNFSPTQVCDSRPFTSSPVHVEVIDSPSCSDTFTSRLSYNATLGMGDSNTIIQVDCSIEPDPPLPGCSPMTVLSHLERNSGFTWCVTNCTGKYMWIK